MLVVSSHQWLVGELEQIIVLVGGFRRKLSECAPSVSGAGDVDAAAAQHDRDVDAGLQQIEHLLSALVRIHPDDITDVDIYGCDYSQHERLTSTAGRLLRDNRSLDLQLSQAIRENLDLQLSVERLQSDARRLQNHVVMLEDELDRLHAARNDFRAELSEFLPDSKSMDMKSIVEVFAEITNRTHQLQTINNALQAKVTQLEYASIGQSTELHTTVEDLEVEREAQLKQENGLRRASGSSQQLSDTTALVTEDLVSRINELETQLCLHQNTSAAMKLSLQQEREFSRGIETEKKQLISKIEELQLEAKQTKDEYDSSRKQLDNDNKAVRSQNDELMKKISELEIATTTGASPSNDYSIRQENARLKDEIDALSEVVYRRSKLILEIDDKKRRQQQHHHTHSTDSDSGSAVELEVEQQVDNVAGKVADIHTRLLDQNAALEKAIETREVLCRDLGQAKTDNDRLSDVVGELRAELDHKHLDIARLHTNVADVEDRLSTERREFCEAVELVRRENAAECDKIARENQHLTTLLTELEQSYTEKIRSRNESFKASSSNDENLLLAESKCKSDFSAENGVFLFHNIEEDVATNQVDIDADAKLHLHPQQLQDCGVAGELMTEKEYSGTTPESTLLENSGRPTDSSTQCDDELLANTSAMIDSLQLEMSLLESRNDEEPSSALDADRQQTHNWTDCHSIRSPCTTGRQTEQKAIDAEPATYSETRTNDGELETKISAETNLINVSTTYENIAADRLPGVGQPKSGQTVDGFAKIVDENDECQRELLIGELRTERCSGTCEQLSQELTCVDGHVDETAAKLASNAQMMEKLRVENNKLRQKLRQQLCVEICQMEVTNRWDNDVDVEDVDGNKSDETSGNREDNNCRRSSSRFDVDHGGDLQAAARSTVEDTSELLSGYDEPRNEKKAPRQHTAETWSVAVQHAISHNVAMQTTGASSNRLHRQSERDIYSLSINNQMLSAELLDVQVRAIDAVRRRLPADTALDVWQSRLRSEIQRKRASTMMLQQRLQHLSDNSDHEDELLLDVVDVPEQLSELKSSLQSDNDALRHVLSTLNELEDGNVLQQRGDVSHHGDDISCLSSTSLHPEMSSLQKLLQVELCYSQSC